MIELFTRLKTKYKKVNYSCEICSSKKFDIILDYGRIAQPGVYGELIIKSCKKCGYKMLNPRYQKKFYEDYYNLVYRKVAFGGYNPSKKYFNEQIMRGRNVLNWFKQKVKITNGIMLDHGCASGGTMIPWVKNGWKAYGIDPHKPSVELGIKSGFNIKLASGESLPFKKNFFDVIMTLGSLEHSFDMKSTLLEIKRVLKKNGYLVIRWRSDKLFGSPIEYYNHNHYRYFTDITLNNLLIKYDFKKYCSTSKKLETWESYKYSIFVNKEKITTKNNKFLKKINEKKLLDEYSNKFYNKCKKIINKHNKDKKIFKKKFLSNGDFKFWKILGGNKNKALNRSIREAVLFIKYYEKNR